MIRMNRTAHTLVASVLMCLGGSSLMAQPMNVLENAEFRNLDEDGVPAGWEVNFGNPATAPELEIVEADGARWARFTMRPNGASMGCLFGTVVLPETAKAVRVTGEVRCEGEANPRDHSVVRLFWYAEPHAHQGWPPWLYRHFLNDHLVGARSSQLDARLLVPEHANRVRIELMARWAPGGMVSFGKLSVEPCDPPERRTAKLAVVQGHAPAKSTVEQACEWAAAQVTKAAEMGADLVCLGEGINMAGTGLKALDCAEPMPGGPMSTALSRASAAHSIYVVAGIYERAGEVAYNSAALFGRDGEFIGAYRKVHLPCAEVDWGFTPGDSYPVFETDLGKVGMQICYDNDFPEGARALALAGADIICLPIWGDGRSDGTAWPASVRMRALENGVFYVTANYSQKRSLIVERNGLVLANANGEEGVYVAEVDLTPGYADVRVTDEGRLMPRSFKDVFRKERMPDTYSTLAGW
jgi:predicted amidohydrolase